MRAIFSVLGLLFVVAVIGLLVKKQLAPVTATPGSAAPVSPASAQQLPQQVRQAVDAALQQPRAMPDEKP